jgi:hypothetical protein
MLVGKAVAVIRERLPYIQTYAWRRSFHRQCHSVAAPRSHLCITDADGSAVLDALGNPNERKLEVSDEILMVCGDCSISMSGRTGFHDVMEDEGRQSILHNTLIMSEEILNRVDRIF